MTRFAGSYSLGRPTRKCAASGRELQVGEVYVATLSEVSGSEAPVRVDYSVEAWTSVTEGKGMKRPRGVMAFWRTHVHDPAKKTEAKILDDDALTDLFEQTETAGVVEVPAAEEAGAEGSTASAVNGVEATQRRLALRFVLALLMLRRKLLVLENTRPGMMLVRHKGTPRPPEGPALIEVIDPGVDEATVISVISELEGDSAAPASSTVSVPTGAVTTGV